MGVPATVIFLPLVIVLLAIFQAKLLTLIRIITVSESHVIACERHTTVMAVFLEAVRPQSTCKNDTKTLKSTCSAGERRCLCSGMISLHVIKLWHRCTYSTHCHSERPVIRRCLPYSTQGTELWGFFHAAGRMEWKTCSD